MRPECRHCGEYLIRANTGPPPTYCSTRCRVAAHRARRAIPSELTGRDTWVRASGKRPIRPDGSPASSTDADTWTSFADAQSGEGDGFGIMLGGGLGCYDLDHISDDAARDFISTITDSIVYVERSRSGEGVHIFVRTDARRGYRRDGVEFYPRSRFIRMTGIRFD